MCKNMKLTILRLTFLLLFLSKGMCMAQESLLQQSDDIQCMISSWQKFLSDNDWQELIQEFDPIQGNCGTVYELPNYLNRENENLAIVDMRAITVAEPHYHPDEDIEIYLVLQGTARVIVGRNEYDVKPGDVVVIPPNKAHFTFPDKEYVIACVNTPPYKPEHYIPVYETNEEVEFDRARFEDMLQ